MLQILFQAVKLHTYKGLPELGAETEKFRH